MKGHMAKVFTYAPTQSKIKELLSIKVLFILRYRALKEKKIIIKYILITRNKIKQLLFINTLVL